MCTFYTKFARVLRPTTRGSIAGIEVTQKLKTTTFLRVVADGHSYWIIPMHWKGTLQWLLKNGERFGNLLQTTYGNMSHNTYAVFIVAIRLGQYYIHDCWDGPTDGENTMTPSIEQLRRTHVKAWLTENARPSALRDLWDTLMSCDTASARRDAHMVNRVHIQLTGTELK